MALTIATIVTVAVPSHATVTGSIGFQCEANFPEWPSVGNAGTCSGLFAGSLTGATDAGDPFAMAGLGGLTASFTYFELCTGISGFPPPFGGANGVATLGPWTVTVGTTVTAATAEVPFQWTRAGLTAVVLVGGVSGNGNKAISFGNVDTASDAIGGVGVATFGPILTPSNVCPFGGPMTAQIVGADLETI